MRLIRLKLQPDVAELLREVSQEFNIQDPGFTEDLFALMRFKGGGLPAQSRIQSMAQQAAKKAKLATSLGIALLLAKRKEVLLRIAKLAYFRGICQSRDMVLSVRTLLLSFRKFYVRVREAQCSSCPHLKACKYGQQYGKTASQITKVLDPNYASLVHKDCPVFPEIEGLNQLNQAIIQFQQMVQAQIGSQSKGVKAELVEQQQAAQAIPNEEDKSTLNLDPEESAENFQPIRTGPGWGVTNRFDGFFTGDHVCKVNEEFIDKLTKSQLALYELGRQFDIALGKSKRANFKPVPHVSQDRTHENVKSESDLPKVVGNQHGLPEEVFNAKMEKRQLLKNQDEEPESKKQLLYLLIDSSGSMDAGLGYGSAHGTFTRGGLATVFGLSLVRKLKADGGLLYIRYFDGAPGPLHKALTPDEFDRMADFMCLDNYGGGGTDIPAALKQAVDDIVKADPTDKLARAEILIITDAESCFNELPATEAVIKQKKIELSILDVSGSQSGAEANMKRICQRYYKVDATVPDVNKIISLL